MQYLKITKDLTLSKLSNTVGERNVDSVLNANGLSRTVKIGELFYDRAGKVSASDQVDYQKKLNLLNQFVSDYDLYEKAALGSEQDWLSLAQYNCFLDAIKIPDDVQLPPSEGLLGSGISVPNNIYQACVASLRKPPDHVIDPVIFAEYDASFTTTSFGVTSGKTSAAEPFQWFKIPWGDVCLYTSLSDEMLYFPVYPEELSDGYVANYEEMPEMLYQYEPWEVYKSSGPRDMQFTFSFHRDMWTGDHRDGYANALIRKCEANCFPEYNGSLVNVATVSLYIKGQNYITGVMKDCNVKWSGPLGLDGFYLYCELTFSIREVSPEPLNYSTVRNKGLIS